MSSGLGAQLPKQLCDLCLKAWQTYLQVSCHGDREFVQFNLRGIQHRFRIGGDTSKVALKSAKHNMLSTRDLSRGGFHLPTRSASRQGDCGWQCVRSWLFQFLWDDFQILRFLGRLPSVRPSSVRLETERGVVSLVTSAAWHREDMARVFPDKVGGVSGALTVDCS